MLFFWYYLGAKRGDCGTKHTDLAYFASKIHLLLLFLPASFGTPTASTPYDSSAPPVSSVPFLAAVFFCCPICLSRPAGASYKGAIKTLLHLLRRNFLFGNLIAPGVSCLICLSRSAGVSCVESIKTLLHLLQRNFLIANPIAPGVSCLICLSCPAGVNCVESIGTLLLL